MNIKDSPLMRGDIRTIFGRKEYRKEWRKWLREPNWTLFVTLNFNRPTTSEAARQKFGELLKRYDREILGPRWWKKPDDRTLAVAFVENPLSNLHLHALFRLEEPGKERPLRWHVRWLQRIWKKLVEQGQCHVQPITDIRGGVLSYAAKQLSRHDCADKFILSVEFENDPLTRQTGD